MIIQTKDLTGTALDWAFHECEYRRRKANGEHIKQWVMDRHIKGETTEICWDDVGEVIEREKIESTYNGIEWYCRTAQPPSMYAEGSTNLVAAMRCLVKTKLGSEVMVPDELMELK